MAHYFRSDIGGPEADMVFASARIQQMRWLSAGYRQVRGGPIRISCYYIDPYCDPECRLNGPFRSKQAAMLWLTRIYGPARREP